VVWFLLLLLRKGLQRKSRSPQQAGEELPRKARFFFGRGRKKMRPEKAIAPWALAQSPLCVVE
jgi:hypothetical protein